MKTMENWSSNYLFLKSLFFYIESPKSIPSHGVQYSPIIKMYNTTALQKCKTFCREFMLLVFCFLERGVSIQDYKIPIYTKVRENTKIRNL